MKIKEFIIKLSKPLSNVVSIIFFAAGLLNLIFNNPAFGFEGDVFINAIIFFIGFPAAKSLSSAINKMITDEWDRAIAQLLLWFNAIMFFAAGIYTLTFGTIPDMVGIPMVALVILSSSVLLYRLWKWRWFR